ncbi:hypothetical protein UFOVP1292_65 [uncultured Caudovirales phage]|uniref:Uncharacterized protein n=1 Tax=uncultured Caudovirales phage TaxID=2100421 RepID=A0A6J5P9D1_9CAUD|nr:hypothetical protein UFOVP859_30 [uncultured Caudovirales phage]CAB4168479.1 hypothetical protein UFOVP882_27 [uncultured Caudovirales phage]CAB4196461.1 hypothetical protein UFOVP1292_65 [uncultured Caudovirales phage]CAB4205279.1 hypothetical protein UFOVP1411_56 [uncultured Caudovirales phage]
MTQTTLRQGFVTGSGAVLDVTSNVTVENTRVHAIAASGIGTFLITGVSTGPYSVKGNNIKFVLTTAIDQQYMDFGGTLGVRMDGPVKVSAPTSAATVAIFYG